MNFTRAAGCHPRLRGYWSSFASSHGFFESYRNMPPHLDRQNNCGREQQRSDGDVSYSRDHHGQLGLNCIMAPCHPGKKCHEAEAKLGEQ